MGTGPTDAFSFGVSCNDARSTSSRVPFGLPASLDHRIVPALRPSNGGPAFGLIFRLRRELKRLVGVCAGGLFAALFGFQHETVAFVEVDASRIRRAVLILKRDIALEDVGVLRNVGSGCGTSSTSQRLCANDGKLARFAPLR